MQFDNLYEVGYNSEDALAKGGKKWREDLKGSLKITLTLEDPRQR